MADIILAKRVIDYVGLGAKGIPESQARLFKELGLNLSLMQGMGSDGAKLISVDQSGNLQIGVPDAAAGNISAPGGSYQLTGKPYTSATFNPFNNPWLLTVSWLTAFNGGFPQPLVSGNQASIGVQQSTGALVATPPGEWSTFSTPAVGSQASLTRGAGGGNLRHVCKSIALTLSASTAPAATNVLVTLRDGASGVGPNIWGLAFQILAAVFAPVTLSLTGLNIVGSPNAAMTLEFAAGVANVQESVAISGMDAN